MPMNPRLMRPLARRQAPAPTDPYFSSVSLLLHFDGSFADSSANAVALTVSGDADTSDAVKKFGSHSGYFDGDSDYIYLAASPSPLFGFGTGDFTLECWVYPLDTEANDVIIDTRPGDVGQPLVFGRSSAGALRWYDGATVFTAGFIPQDEWSHIAWSRSGGTSRLFVNGQEVDSFADSADCGSSRGLTVGANADPQYENFYGYIDDLRITKGVARYAANFTPPTAPFPNSGPPAPPAPLTDPLFSSVSLLLHFDGANGSTTFTDSSASPKTVTANGNAQISTALSKFGGASGLFDGEGDWLSIPSSSTFDFGAGDFTVEFWVNVVQATAYGGLVSFTTGPGFGVGFGDSDNKIRVIWDSAQQILGDTAVTENTWTHIAVVRFGGTVTVYQNGTSVGSQAITGNMPFEDIGAGIGRLDVTLDQYYFNGYIDDLRITKGTARYTAAFTPPTAPFPPAPPFQPIPIMTSATTPSGEASASAILAEGLEAWRAFDKETVSGDTTFYASAVGAVDEWIQYDFGFTVTAGGYQFHSRVEWPYGNVQAPPAWTLSGSVDGVTFTTIDTRTGVTDWNGHGELKTFTLSSPASYRYWRWTWDAAPPEPAVVLPKIQLVE